jgi:hypothetical protein
VREEWKDWRKEELRQAAGSDKTVKEAGGGRGGEGREEG